VHSDIEAKREAESVVWNCKALISGRLPKIRLVAFLTATAQSNLKQDEAAAKSRCSSLDIP